MEGEAYFDIVWKQFRKNRVAVGMLGIVAAMFLAAILAPVLSSNQPFWFREADGSLVFPWFVSLLNADTAIDLVFNVALLALFPWFAAALIYTRLAARRGVPGRKRLAAVTLGFLALLGVLLLLILLSSDALGSWTRYLSSLLIFLVALSHGTWMATRPAGDRASVQRRLWNRWIPAYLLLLLAFGMIQAGIPDNKFFSRDFKKDQQSRRGSGVYPLIPYGPLELDLDIIYKPPFFRKTGELSRFREGDVHLMGTDDSGRDVLTRLLYGTRISITIGMVAVSIYLTIGICIGAVAGYFGGRVDMVISRLIEIVLLFPSFFLILTLVALIGPSIYIIMVVIGLTGWPTIARLTRGEFLKQRSIDYVSAARALGASNLRVMFRHILPNALSPAFVSAPFGIAGAIVTEATLSVLGFGARPPAPSWGAILNLSVQNYEKWWFTVFAGVSIFVTMTVFNVVGNGLRDAMDPRLKGTR
ncbi:MAG TPA: ABC transporter permease [Planctomycetota bacterium]|nr:ABC transporter permease [Planctomycetota bacterium]